VFFEEWDDPLISGIAWVSELVEIAGGIDIFADRRNQGAVKYRVVTAEEVVAGARSMRPKSRISGRATS
jgi:iron complex transport system substrate-binding protein